MPLEVFTLISLTLKHSTKNLDDLHLHCKIAPRFFLSFITVHKQIRDNIYLIWPTHATHTPLSFYSKNFTTDLKSWTILYKIIICLQQQMEPTLQELMSRVNFALFQRYFIWNVSSFHFLHFCEKFSESLHLQLMQSSNQTCFQCKN